MLLRAAGTMGQAIVWSTTELHAMIIPTATAISQPPVATRGIKIPFYPKRIWKHCVPRRTFYIPMVSKIAKMHVLMEVAAYLTRAMRRTAGVTIQYVLITRYAAIFRTMNGRVKMCRRLLNIYVPAKASFHRKGVKHVRRHVSQDDVAGMFPIPIPALLTILQPAVSARHCCVCLFLALPLLQVEHSLNTLFFTLTSIL